MHPIIDHLVYAVPHLEQGIEEIDARFGVRPQYGGRHLSKGTHNALIGLGSSCYFEIIAPDPENKNIQPPRWMGVDLIQKPSLTRWAISTPNIQQDAALLGSLQPALAQLEKGSRQTADGTTLSWELSVPLAQPTIEIAPFLIHWGDTPHPSSKLAKGCKLLSLRAMHPQIDTYRNLIDQFGINIQFEQAAVPQLIATFDTPNGKVSLT